MAPTWKFSQDKCWYPWWIMSLEQLHFARNLLTRQVDSKIYLALLTFEFAPCSRAIKAVKKDKYYRQLTGRGGGALDYSQRSDKKFAALCCSSVAMFPTPIVYLTRPSMPCKTSTHIYIYSRQSLPPPLPTYTGPFHKLNLMGEAPFILQGVGFV